jgi:hypothetical protein
MACRTRRLRRGWQGAHEGRERGRGDLRARVCYTKTLAVPVCSHHQQQHKAMCLAAAMANGWRVEPASRAVHGEGRPTPALDLPAWLDNDTDDSEEANRGAGRGRKRPMDGAGDDVMPTGESTAAPGSGLPAEQMWEGVRDRLRQAVAAF